MTEQRVEVSPAEILQAGLQAGVALGKFQRRIADRPRAEDWLPAVPGLVSAGEKLRRKLNIT